MISNRFSKILRGLLVGGTLSIAFSPLSASQVQSTKKETHGEAVKEVKVERGEIVYVNGNTVVVKMEDGTLKEFDNVPESVSFMVDGKPVNIRNAKVGMKLEKQTVTTTTPKVVTTVETVTGKVWQVIPPKSVILTLENGENQQFKVPDGQKLTIDGQETDVWGLKKGMKVTAQRVTEVPETVVAQQVKRTGSAPPPPPPPQPGVPVLVVVTEPVPAPPAQTAAAEPAEAAPAKLPKTASDMPLVGLAGLLFCGLSLTAMSIRMIFSRYMNFRH
jgi:hypothetical protein